MATTEEQWASAFSLLQQFERQLIEPSNFSWKYLTENTGVSKATLWRNSEFESEFQRVRAIVKAYSAGEVAFDQELSIKASLERDKDRQIETLKAKVDELNRQLSRERERLVYASLIARRRNLDPADFMDNSPFRPVSRAKETVTPITKGAKTGGRKPRV